MEPPAKRQRRQKSMRYHLHHDDNDDDDDDDYDELSFEPLEIRAKRDSSYRLSLERAHADNRYQATMAHIFEKYGRDFDGIGDEIDLLTGEILVDNGHLQNMRDEGDVGVANDGDDDPGLSMEDLVHNQDDDLFSSPSPAQRFDQSTGEEDEEEDRIMFGRKPDSQSLTMFSQPPSRTPDDGLSSLTGLFGTGRPPVYGASPLGFGASPFAMEPWTISDPFGLSPWDPPRLFPSPTDRYHFPSQDGGNSIWQPGYRFKDDEADVQPMDSTVLARVRPDVRIKPMKYMLPSSASRPDDAEDQEEIDEDAILMGKGGAFPQFDVSTSTHMEIDELVMPIPQEIMPPPTDTQTDSTTTETEDAPPPKKPRLARTSPEQATEKQQQRFVVELQALHPSLRHEYASIDEAAADDVPDDDQTLNLDAKKPALFLDGDDDTKPSSQGRSNAEGLKEQLAPDDGSVLHNVPTTNPTLCLSDDEMPISLPKPKPQQPAAPKESNSPPPEALPEAPPTSMKDATIPAEAPSSPAQQVSTRARRSKKASAEVSAPILKRSPPPLPTSRRKTRSLGRELRWLEKLNSPLPISGSSRRRPVEPPTEAEVQEPATAETDESPTNPEEEIASTYKEAIASIPREVITSTPKEAIISSPEEAISSTPKEALTSTPKKGLAATPKEAIALILKEALDSTPKEAIISTPKEAISSTLKKALTSTTKEATTSTNTPSDKAKPPHPESIASSTKHKPQAKPTQTETPKRQAEAESSSKTSKSKPRTPRTAPPPSQRSILSLAADDDDLDDLGRDLFAPVTAPRRTKIWKSTTRTREVLRSPVKRRPTDVVSPRSIIKTPGGTVRTCGLDGYRCGRDFCFSCL